MIRYRPATVIENARMRTHVRNLAEAHRRGGCDYAEGEPVYLNPYTDPELAKAWRDSWVRAWQRRPTA